MQNGFNQGNASSLSLLNFGLGLEYAIRKDRTDGTRQLLAYADDFNTVDEDINTVKKTQELCCRLVARLIWM
jgi:hypothetical protein